MKVIIYCSIILTVNIIMFCALKALNDCEDKIRGLQRTRKLDLDVDS